ncbi:MAG: hypothetical protein GC192_17660 [Bacteroidetes bacterium]|nr:hypothetical protein [Bacteroidota bacterium]
MENFIIFVSVVNTIFCTLVIFLEKGDKLKAIAIVLVASLVASGFYFGVLGIINHHLTSKVVGTWEDNLKVDGITFTEDGLLRDIDGAHQIELFGKRYFRFEVESGKGKYDNLILYSYPENKPDPYLIILVGNYLQIGEYIYFKKQN